MNIGFFYWTFNKNTIRQLLFIVCGSQNTDAYSNTEQYNMYIEKNCGEKIKDLRHKVSITANTE